MRALLDTNIVIPLEDTARTLSPELAQMCRLADACNISLLVHPQQREDIQRDQNPERREIVLSRIARYQSIESPPNVSDEELGQLGWRQINDNDRVDNLLLQALKRGAVNLLVTNDEGVHRKAKAVSLADQVYRIPQFLALLQAQLPEGASPPPYGIEEKFLYEFDVKQAFFDSLRATYEGFDNWFLRVAQQQRKAWCVTDAGTMLAIAMFKVEDQLEVENPDKDVPTGPSLKLCTFKVGEAVRGRKLGERLLYAAFKYAVKKNISSVYLHTRGAEQNVLVSLCLDYGFRRIGEHNGDDVYMKDMKPPPGLIEADPLDYLVRFYPHYQRHEGVDKFLVPIEPRYHNSLFADTSDTAQGLFADDPFMYSAQANTIKKAYLCHANLRTIKPGDILLFYRSQDRQSIECVGIAELCHRTKDIDEVLPLVSKRTVFSREDLSQMLEKETLVILFRFVGIIEPVFYDRFKAAGICGPIQTIRQITHLQYKALFEEVS